MLQLGVSSKFRFEVGDVKTGFLQGDKTETQRDVYLEPIKEIRERLGLTDNQLLRLLGSAYGLRTDPRSWYLRVRSDLERIGWRMHQLGPCVFLLYEKRRATKSLLCLRRRLPHCRP